MNETRSSQRKKVLKGAIAAFNNRHSTLPCAVRDISETGCRLKVAGAITVPDTFELVIELDAVRVPCQVVWRRLSEIGVRFTGAPQQGVLKRAQVVTHYDSRGLRPVLQLAMKKK